MTGMAPPRNKRGGTDQPPNSKPRPIRKGEPLHVWISPAISQAIDAYLEGTAPRVSKTAAVEEALRRFLQSVGHWPPPSVEKGQ